MKTRHICVALCPLFAAAVAVAANHAFVEPPAWRKLALQLGKTGTAQALADAGMAQTCDGALSATDLLGVQCRTVLAGALVRGTPLRSGVDIDAIFGLADGAATLAVSLGDYEPLSPQEGFARARFDATARACRVAADGYDRLQGLSVDHPAHGRAVALLSRASSVNKPSLQVRMCSCAQRAVDLAVAANATLEERGAVQALVTSHGCGLDASRLQGDMKPGALQGNSTAQGIGKGLGADGAIRSYAQTRTIDFDRCVQKHVDDAGHVRDDAKMQECACNVVKRWKLPPTTAQTTLPLTSTTELALTVDKGAVTACALAPVAPAQTSK